MITCCPLGDPGARKGVFDPVGTAAQDHSGLRTHAPSMPVAITVPPRGHGALQDGIEAVRRPLASLLCSTCTPPLCSAAAYLTH